MKKAKQPLIYVICAVSSFALEYILLFLMSYLFRGQMEEYTKKIIARIISSFFNFNLNYRFVFAKDETYGKSLVKYYCLAIPMMFLSAWLLDRFAVWTRIEEITADSSKLKSAALHTLINGPVDLVIAAVNFVIQKFWVFAKRKT